MPKNQIDYSKTIIYKLCCDDTSITDIYIGHTTNFEQRKNNHRIYCENLNCTRYVYEFIRHYGDWDNWSMIQIEEFECANKRQAEARENYWIQTLNATLNTNKPYTTAEEKSKQKQDWYEENKPAILDKRKQHYEENKETILQKQKQYAEEHKEEIAIYQKQYNQEHKEEIAEQKKIYRQEHKEEAKIAGKKWREENAEKVKKQKSEVINCECGLQYTFGNMHRHLQSKAHLDFQNSLTKTEKQEEDTKKQLEEEKLVKRREQQKLYREKNKDKIQQYKKAHYNNNKEAILEKNQQYREEHKEEIQEKTKKYIEENKDRIKAYKETWYQKNKERILNKKEEITT